MVARFLSLSTPLTAVPNDLAPTAVQVVLVNLMGLFWLLAIVIAVWGSLREERRADQERRRIGDDPMGGPTPGIEGVLDHWGLWSVILLVAGFICLALFSRAVTL